MFLDILDITFWEVFSIIIQLAIVLRTNPFEVVEDQIFRRSSRFVVELLDLNILENLLIPVLQIPIVFMILLFNIFFGKVEIMLCWPF